MRKTLFVVGAMMLALTLTLNTAEAQRKSKAQKNREEIDTMVKNTLKTLFDKDSDAKELSGKAYGYAVFDNAKISLVISGGGGRGVAGLHFWGVAFFVFGRPRPPVGGPSSSLSFVFSTVDATTCSTCRVVKLSQLTSARIDVASMCTVSALTKPAATHWARVRSKMRRYKSAPRRWRIRVSLPAEFLGAFPG